VIKKESAILVSIMDPDMPEYKFYPRIEEFKFLADSSGASVKTVFIQKLDKSHPKFFVGSGKLKEIKTYIDDNEIDMAIFDGELSSLQIKNIEDVLNIKVLDKTNLILDIFASRAQTNQAKTQVELAQLQYLLPRLTNLWTHLSRQKGGIGMKGPGEKEIETDRRNIRTKLSLLKEKLEKINLQNQTRRKSRGDVVKVALVGYTNVGKSTIMNLLSNANVEAENKLFATLDTTVRKGKSGEVNYIISDTVGFIRDLPHTLIESFKSTLDEVKDADFILHVVDVSSPEFEDQITVVNDTLKEIGIVDKDILHVFNKIDSYYNINLLKIDEELTLKERLNFLKASFIRKLYAPAIFVNAINGFNIDFLKRIIHNKVGQLQKERLDLLKKKNQTY
jgi:GTP-binding protein HflX